jgi:hypothetical protein
MRPESNDATSGPVHSNMPNAPPVPQLAFRRPPQTMG